MNKYADIPTELINEVHSRICNEDYSAKLSLIDGVIGLLLYRSLHSELYEDVEERLYCQNLVVEIVNLVTKKHKLNKNFLNGPLSFPFVIGILVKNGIMDYDQELVSCFVRRFMYTTSLNVFPSIIIGDKTCVGEALSVSSLFMDKDDSLLRYSIQESLIAFIDHCGRLLNEDIPKLYSRQDMNNQYLHSIYFFLQWTQKYRIYPVKVDCLLKTIDNWPECLIDKTDICHLQILHKLQGKDVNFSVFKKESPDVKLNTLAILGIYSALYDIDIFEDFIQSVYIDGPRRIMCDLLDVDHYYGMILGLGIGLLRRGISYSKTNKV